MMRAGASFLTVSKSDILSKMKQETKLDRFAKYAWYVLAWNVVVIGWGVFLRASKSGDGCGEHWLTQRRVGTVSTAIQDHRLHRTTVIDGFLSPLIKGSVSGRKCDREAGSFYW
jgi:hypothetical protein